jgi:hypothetical protein
MNQSWLVDRRFIIGSPLVLLAGIIVVCWLSPNLPTTRRQLMDEKWVQRSLTEYASPELVKKSNFDQYGDFNLALQAVTFPAGSSVDELIKRLDEQIPESQRSSANLKLTFIKYIEQVGLLFASGSRFDGKVQVNLPPRSDFINIYLIDEDRARLVQNFNSNCVYIGYLNAIVCDVRFFKKYFSFIDGISKIYDIVLTDITTRAQVPIEGQLLEKVRLYMKQSFIVWVLGHEIGHAILHKDVVLARRRQLHFDLDYDEYEVAADTFAAEKLAPNTALASNFSIASGEFIHQEYRRLYRESFYDGSDMDSRDFIMNNSLVVNYDRYRVPVLLRAIRVVNRLGEVNHSVDGTGYFGGLEKNITTISFSP